MEAKRRCGWLPQARWGPRAIVWARKTVYVETCPKSYVSAESMSLMEAFTIWKLLGGGDVGELPARTVDAFCLLENELRAELSHATE